MNRGNVMNANANHISVLDPIGPAIERVRQMLFRPFDLGRWFAIGLCAWLAYFAPGGGVNIRLPFDNFGQTNNSQCSETLYQAYMPLIIFASVFAFILVIGIWLLVLWLNSRGRFMFLNCVARNTDKIKEPWGKYKTLANNLLLFRIAAVIIFCLALVPFIAVIVWCGILLSKSSACSTAVLISTIVFMSLILIILSALLIIIMKFTFDFVVPIMYIHNIRCVQAWGRFRSILSANKGKFFLYILFQIVIGIAVGGIVATAILATCCCAACIFMIPYIGTVAILPLLVFERAYSVYYLRQYGTEFDVFAQIQTDENLLPAQ